ncbi:MAG: hypothetical protein O7I93_10245 [Gemmatimonadetes bacterium]|nr:hypothetical protein [Gemmatimonadota bacterium]
MAFPHGLIVRVAWFASAALAVVMISNKLRDDDDGAAISSRQVVVGVEVREAPRPVPEAGVEPEDVIVAITRVGDDESRVEGFTLTRPLDVRVVALGESTGGEMHDYGAILEATSRRAVWAMEADRTHHAGGGEKNRMVDEMISLEAGDYLVYYISDGSHSFDGWNTGAPSSPELWGITLMGAHGSPARGAVRPYDDRDNAAVLARIVEVADGQHRVERFTMASAADVRIYAIGEGDQSDMYDYATLEDAATGDVVWSMTYRQTEHAGGAQKNRLFDGVIRLEAGVYHLVYRTDDSHSFDDWNSAAPHDPFSYGVTVFRR